MSAPRDVRVLADSDELGSAAARFVVDVLARAIERSSRATIALTGGSTPVHLHRKLAAEHARSLDWSRVQFWFGDERCVPLGSPDSNYRMARETLLEPLSIASDAVHPMPAETPDHDAAARAYERELRAVFGGAATFDLALLGLGEDAHVASLFPGSAEVAERARWVVPVETRAKPPPHRLSLTLPVFALSETVAFLVGGAAKRDAVRRVLAPGNDADRALPAARVTARAKVVWFLDRAAGGP